MRHVLCHQLWHMPPLILWSLSQLTHIGGDTETSGLSQTRRSPVSTAAAQPVRVSYPLLVFT